MTGSDGFSRLVVRRGPALALALLSACRSEPVASTAPSASASMAVRSAQPPVTIQAERWSPRPQTLEIDGMHDVQRLAFSDDGARLAASFRTLAGDPWRAEIAVWSVDRGVLVLRAVLPPDFRETGALAFARDGGVLAGERGWGSFVWHSYVRVRPSGHVGPMCHEHAPGVARRPGPQPRGVGSIVELADGRVVTGGRDDSLAVWSATGCEATWPRGRKCGWAESIVQVARDTESSGFSTLGETSWMGEEATPPLGVQRWRGPPWKREAVSMGTSKEDLSDTHLMSPNGLIVRRPSTDGGKDRGLGEVAPDGSCAAVAADQTVWIEDIPARRRRSIDMSGKISRLAVAPRCAAIAVEIDHTIRLCREGVCLPR